MKELISTLKRKQEYLRDHEEEDYNALYLNRTHLDCLLGILKRLDGMDDGLIDIFGQNEAKEHSVPFQIITKQYFKKGMQAARDYIKGEQKQS